jgi:hypothetical protein
VGLIYKKTPETMKDGRKGRLARIARPNEHYAVECSGFYFCLEYMKLGARKASNRETSTGTDKKKKSTQPGASGSCL